MPWRHTAGTGRGDRGSGVREPDHGAAAAARGPIAAPRLGGPTPAPPRPAGHHPAPTLKSLLSSPRSSCSASSRRFSRSMSNSCFSPGRCTLTTTWARQGAGRVERGSKAPARSRARLWGAPAWEAGWPPKQATPKPGGPSAAKPLTSCPLCSTARCTCPRLAAAIGRRSNSRNSAPTGRPRSFSMMATALSELNAGTRSCSLASSSTKAAGNRSERVLLSWPIWGGQQSVVRVRGAAATSQARGMPCGRGAESSEGNAPRTLMNVGPRSRMEATR
jgi:hypothetical protein